MSKECFVLADYVNDFKCKCGDCRNCCCVGWPVTISYKEYVKLLGIDCNKKLRKRIDCAFFILSDCTPERYAEINRTVDGECHLRDADGKCALQKALGEGALPAVCKMYPRNFKAGGIREGACSLSCEGVCETLFRNTEKLRFHTAEIDVDTPSSHYAVMTPEFAEIQREAIEILQNRNDNMAERLVKLGVFADKLCVEPIEQAEKDISLEFDKIKPSDEYPALDVALKLCDFLTSYSQSFADYGEPALSNLYFDSEKSDITALMERYVIARNNLYSALPDFDYFMEDILVNHLFFMQFPQADAGMSVRDEYTSFVGIYALTKLVAVGYMKGKSSVSDFVDCVAGIFRYIEHANSMQIIKSSLATFSFDSLDNLAALAEL